MAKRDRSSNKRYDNIHKITTGWGEDCLVDYAAYFKKYYMIISLNLRKQQTLDADPKAIQKINVSVNLYQGGNVFYYWSSERNHFKEPWEHCNFILN